MQKDLKGWPRIKFHARCIVAIFAQLNYINGMWFLVDACIYYNVWWRSALYIIAGLIMCWAAGARVTDCCSIPPEHSFISFHQPNDMAGASVAFINRESDSPSQSESFLETKRECVGYISGPNVPVSVDDDGVTETLLQAANNI